MSTRCQIGFYDEKPTTKNLDKFEALVYRHSDGYPDGVMPDIMPFLSFWKKSGRGLNDTEYVSARLLQYLANKYDEQSIEFLESNKLKPWYNDKEKKEVDEEIKETETFTGLLGHGISKSFHWDIEYIYAVYPNAVDVYEVHYSGEGADYKPDLKKSKLISSNPIE